MSPLALPPQSYLGWKVSTIILQAIAIMSTIYRLVHRFRRRQAWWDDYIVIIPLVVEAAFLGVVSARYPQPNIVTGADREKAEPGATESESYPDEVYESYWLTMLPCLVIIWTTRTVLSLSLARVFPSKHPARRWSFVLVGFMFLSCVASIAVTIATCKQTSGLLVQAEAQDCVKGPGGFPLKNVFLFADDLLSDVLLVVSPLVIFWRLRLPRHEQRLVLMVTYGSSLILLSAIAFLIITNSHATSMGDDTILFITGLGNLESAISLFVCNLPVISTCLYRVVRHILHLEGSDAEGTAESLQHSSRSCSCCSDVPPTPLTLTEISDSSFPSNRRSEHSFGMSHSSSQAAGILSRHSDLEIAEKQRIQKSYSENDLGLSNKPL